MRRVASAVAGAAARRGGLSQKPPRCSPSQTQAIWWLQGCGRHRAVRAFSTVDDEVGRQPDKWAMSELKSMLEQVADVGTLDTELHMKLVGTSSQLGARSVSDGDANGESASPLEEEVVDDSLELAPEDDVVACGLSEFVLASELCSSSRFRDYVLMGKLAERMVPLVPEGSHSSILRLASAYSLLGVLNAPLFEAIARSIQSTWQSAAKEPSAAELTQVARCFSGQRDQSPQLFDVVVEKLRKCTTASDAQVSPSEALSLLHSFAFLRKDADLGTDLWEALETRALSPGAANLGPVPVAQFCHVLFLTRRDTERLQDILQMLHAVSGQVLAIDPAGWTTSTGASLRHQLLLLRSALRYLHREAYQEMSPELSQALRAVHRLELPDPDPKPVVNFIRKLSHILTKLRIGHMVNAQRGPLLLDIVERDRKLVYECNHFDRYYNGSTQKIASMCLQERIVKAMGYRVVQVPHWQWGKIRHKRQRIEYVRMSRYYAIKDRREFAPRDEPMEDLCVNELDYQGEYFFRKDQPSSAWSWFQPRYDATKRLPTPPASGGAEAGIAAQPR
mmetsp:Transcript_35314/g.82460  ORF Transcript_35314/g.82460 Transcript_35314/m.82460 type:complete len:563 (+) Transcript_35314:54-1742(+)